MQNGLYKVNGGTDLFTAAQVREIMERKRKAKVRDVPDYPIYPEWLRAMTTHFPWAWLIAKGYKEEEYRNQARSFPEVCLIHAGYSMESDWAMQEYNIPRREIQRGAIIGATRIVRCSRGEEGGFAYELRDAVFFPEAIKPVSGKQALFWRAIDVPTIRAFNRAWMYWEAAWK